MLIQNKLPFIKYSKVIKKEILYKALWYVIIDIIVPIQISPVAEYKQSLKA